MPAGVAEAAERGTDRREDALAGAAAPCRAHRRADPSRAEPPRPAPAQAALAPEPQSREVKSWVEQGLRLGILAPSPIKQQTSSPSLRFTPGK